MKKIETENLTLVLHEELPANEAKGYAPSYRFAIRKKTGQERIGHITLRAGNDSILRDYSGHLSYRIDEPHRGHHFAAEACRAMLPFADSLGVKPIRITCDPDNIASRRTCESSGGKYLGDVDVPPGNYVYESGGRRKSQFEFTMERT
jgi:predicted acetyltransferase